MVDDFESCSVSETIDYTSPSLVPLEMEATAEFTPQTVFPEAKVLLDVSFDTAYFPGGTRLEDYLCAYAQHTILYKKAVPTQQKPLKIIQIGNNAIIESIFRDDIKPHPISKITDDQGIAYLSNEAKEDDMIDSKEIEHRDFAATQRRNYAQSVDFEAKFFPFE